MLNHRGGGKGWVNHGGRVRRRAFADGFEHASPGPRRSWALSLSQLLTRACCRLELIFRRYDRFQLHHEIARKCDLQASGDVHSHHLRPGVSELAIHLSSARPFISPSLRPYALAAFYLFCLMCHGMLIVVAFY